MAVESKEMLRLTNMHKWYGQLHVLRGIDLTVSKSEKLVIIGASGSGKSTLLRCVVGIEEIDEGQVDIEGCLFQSAPDGKPHPDNKRNMRKLRDRVGMVFQSYNLFPHMTVLENIIEAPVHVKKMPKATAVERAEDLLAQVGLLDKRDVYPSKLSGGQKQRTAIARALAMDPDIMLFDEVTSALDPELIGEVLDVMRQLALEGMTMLVVTHELSFAEDVGERVIYMHEGKIIEEASPQVLFQCPSHERTKQFLKRILEH